jgi:hypothetical protein
MATYTKLRSGDWGIRGRGLVEGRDVTVTKKSGETKTERVTKIIWTGSDGTQLATIEQRPIARSESCAECGRWGACVEAADSSGIVARVCRRCASMSEWERSYA